MAAANFKNDDTQMLPLFCELCHIGRYSGLRIRFGLSFLVLQNGQRRPM